MTERRKLRQDSKIDKDRQEKNCYSVCLENLKEKCEREKQKRKRERERCTSETEKVTQGGRETLDSEGNLDTDWESKLGKHSG